MRCARLDRRVADGDARVPRAGARLGQKHAADRLAGQGSIFDAGGCGGAETGAVAKHHPAIPAGEFEKPEPLKLEKETLGRYVSEHALKAVREQLAPGDRPRPLRARSAAATARS